MEFDHAAFLARLNTAEMGQRLREQLAAQPEEESPAFVLKGILQVKDASGNERTIEQIKGETAEFFSRPEVVADMALFNELSVRFAMECQFHSHGQELANSTELNGIYNNGMNESDHHDHVHEDPLEKSKKKKRSNSSSQRAGSLIFNFGNAASVSGFRIFKSAKTNK